MEMSNNLPLIFLLKCKSFIFPSPEILTNAFIEADIKLVFVKFFFFFFFIIYHGLSYSDIFNLELILKFNFLDIW